MNDWLARRVGPRLRAVAERVEGRVVADVGSDHGLLPAFLLRSGRVERVIVVEKHAAPFARCVATLARVAAEVRRGDGLSVLWPGEVSCVSMSGFGAAEMARILRAHPERVPPRVVAQPNHSGELLLEWADAVGYALVDEVEVVQGRAYRVYLFRAPA